MSSTGRFHLTKSPGTCSRHTITVRLSRSDHLVEFRAASSGLAAEEVLSGCEKRAEGACTDRDRAPKYSSLGDTGPATASFSLSRVVNLEAPSSAKHLEMLQAHVRRRTGQTGWNSGERQTTQNPDHTRMGFLSTALLVCASCLWIPPSVWLDVLGYRCGSCRQQVALHINTSLKRSTDSLQRGRTELRRERCYSHNLPLGRCAAASPPSQMIPFIFA